MRAEIWRRLAAIPHSDHLLHTLPTSIALVDHRIQNVRSTEGFRMLGVDAQVLSVTRPCLITDLVFPQSPTTICHGSTVVSSLSRMTASLGPLTWNTTLVRPLRLRAGRCRYSRLGLTTDMASGCMENRLNFLYLTFVPSKLTEQVNCRCTYKTNTYNNEGLGISIAARRFKSWISLLLVCRPFGGKFETAGHTAESSSMCAVA